MARAEAGEEIVIARRDKPAVKLVPVSCRRQEASRARSPRASEGQACLTTSFFEPMSEDELRAWEGKYSFDWNRSEILLLDTHALCLVAAYDPARLSAAANAAMPSRKTKSL